MWLMDYLLSCIPGCLRLQTTEYCLLSSSVIFYQVVSAHTVQGQHLPYCFSLHALIYAQTVTETHFYTSDLVWSGLALLGDLFIFTFRVVLSLLLCLTADTNDH